MKIKKELKNKKGFLLGEVSVKLVIAILCILLLIILGVKLFGMFSKENDVKKAEDNLNLIADKIAYLNSPEYTENFLYVTVFPPEESGWFIKSHSRGYFPSKQCNSKHFKSCLCMCNSLDCTGLMACTGFEQEVEVSGSIPKEGIPPGGTSGIEKAVVSGDIVIYSNIIELKGSINELKISKEDSLIKENKIIIKIKQTGR